MLVIAGGVQNGADDGFGELVEDEQVGFELADFVFEFLFVKLALPALACEQCAIGPIGSRGLIAFFAGADVLADDPAFDRAGARVTARVFGEGEPGHGGFGSDADERGRAARHAGAGGRPDQS
jgi:hypothetical protein